MSKLKGYIGEVELDEKGNIKRSNVDKADKIAEIVKFNVNKGNEEAKELGFSKLNGFVMIGADKSITFMKNKAYIIDTNRADWQQIFVNYTFIKAWCAGGVALLVISILWLALAIMTPYLNYFAPEPKFYIPILTLLISIFMISLSKSRFSYRLD